MGLTTPCPLLEKAGENLYYATHPHLLAAAIFLGSYGG